MSLFGNLYQEELSSRAKSVYMYLKDRSNSDDQCWPSIKTIAKDTSMSVSMSGSISRGKNDPSQSLQMIERPLLTVDELKSLPKGNFVIMKTGAHPMQTKLRLFLDWGITFDKPYEMEEKSRRKVCYADKQVL